MSTTFQNFKGPNWTKMIQLTLILLIYFIWALFTFR